MGCECPVPLAWRLNEAVFGFCFQSGVMSVARQMRSKPKNGKQLTFVGGERHSSDMFDDTYYLTRDCNATLIPAGDEVVLEKGAAVRISQALGGSVTVQSPNGLFRIAKAHWDALGSEAEAVLEEALSGSVSEATEGPFSEEQVWGALRTCFDPEIPVNIVDLGLIYDLSIRDTDNGNKQVDVKMTLTAQGCGMGPTIAADAKEKIEALEAVEFAHVQVVWEPPWNPHMISAEGKKKMGLT